MFVLVEFYVVFEVAFVLVVFDVVFVVFELFEVALEVSFELGESLVTVSAKSLAGTVY